MCVNIFQGILSKMPLYEKCGIPYYGSEREGDQFDESDVAIWTAGGGFARRWNERGQKVGNHMTLCQKAAELNKPIMDIAVGPGLGLLPDIFAINPELQALATDACPILVEKWSEFLQKQAPDTNIQFACFNAADMPIRDNSVDVITSNIGFSSLRYAGIGQMDGVKEAYRVLKPGGYIFTIENEFEDTAVVQKVFDLWGKENWFRENKLEWSQRFRQCGFAIEEETFHQRRIENTDWELGEAAASFGLEIAMVFKGFVLRK